MALEISVISGKTFRHELHELARINTPIQTPKAI